MLVYLLPLDAVDLLDLELAVDVFLVPADASETPATFVLTLGGGTLLLFVLPALSISVSRGGTEPPLIVPAAVLAISRFLLASFAVSIAVCCLLGAFAMPLGFGTAILLFNCDSLISPKLGIVVKISANFGSALGGLMPEGFFKVCFNLSAWNFCASLCLHGARWTYGRLQIIHDAQRYNGGAI